MRVDAFTCARLVSGAVDASAVLPSHEEQHSWWDATGGESRGVSVQKLWHAIEWLLGQVDPALDGVFFAGEEVGDDLGYGPARLHQPKAVAAFRGALAATTLSDMRTLFDPEELDAEDVYPMIWDEDPDALWDEILSYLGPLEALIERAGRDGEGLLVWIS